MGQKNKRDIEIAEMSALMSTKGGRNFINRVLTACGVDSDTFHSDPHLHAMQAGRRQIGLWIVNELKSATPGEYMLMLKERNEDDG